MFFFKRRKKEKTLEKKFDEMSGDFLSENDKKDPHKVEHFVIERLEQIIETTKEIEDEKAEYRVVTSYLNDIQMMEDFPEEERGKVNEIAQNIVALDQARGEFLHAEKKISDAQYAQMQQDENDIPNAVKRLKSNEMYLETIKKDMKYLEREKSEWLFYKEELMHEQKKLQNLMYIIIGMAATAAVILIIAQIVMAWDMRLAWTVLLFLTVAGICISYLKIMNAQTEYKRSEANANRAIMLLNKVKIKFVNMTNAIDYACEKYHVNNSAELNHIWECYMEAIKQREKFEKNSDDLEYYSSRLVRTLAKYRLYDTRVWIPQAKALIDHNEMVEITHSLVARRQKLRSRIEYNTGIVKDQRKEVDDLMKNMSEMKPQIQDILNSVDKLSGVN